MTLGRHVSTTVSAFALLLLCHLGCGGSAPVKRASTTGVYTPDEKGEDKIKVSAADPSSRPAAKPTPEPVRTVAADAQPVAAARPIAAAQPAADEPADGNASDAEAAPADADEAEAKPTPVKKARKAKKSKKHKKSKKRRK